MTIDYANDLLVSIGNRGAVNMLQRYSYGTIKEAIRTIFRAKSATKDMLSCASSVEAAILNHHYYNRG